ncbi:hypothetical protein [Algibacter lectus]|nr:hypothetical protein [Algibacter lectus]
MERRLLKPRVEKTIEETMEPEREYYEEGKLLSERFLDKTESGVVKLIIETERLVKNTSIKMGILTIFWNTTTNTGML